jgi:hypothetical protein
MQKIKTIKMNFSMIKKRLKKVRIMEFQCFILRGPLLNPSVVLPACQRTLGLFPHNE